MADSNQTQGRSGGTWYDVIRRRRSALIWTALAAGIVAVQWPMLKGTYYRFSGTPAPAGGIAWRTDFDAALAEARQAGKPLLLDFSASWCPPCQVMKHEVWPDAEVRRTVEEAYIPVLLDIDAPAGQAVAQRYRVQAVPTIAVVDADGRVVRQGTSMSAAALLDFLQAAKQSLVRR